MKKMIAGIASLVVLGAGGVFAVSQASDEPETETASTDNQTENVSINKNDKSTKEDEQPETESAGKTPPSKRSEKLFDKYPWQRETENIKQLRENDEVVYLYDDGAELESFLSDLIEINNKPDSNSSNEINRVSEHLDMYIKDVAEYYPDQQDYFDKLKETHTALSNREYESAKNLIQEAKQIRESE